jgi:serralysin
MPERYIGVPGSDVNSIDPIGGVDTYGVWLTGGQSYDFDAIGHYDTSANGVFDPTLALTSPFGNQVAFDDDGGALDFDAHIDFTAGYSGYYTLAVAGFGDETGTYTLNTSYDDGIV